jgi:1-deoxy-D-xylulose-5-phosphate synthase
MTTGSLRSETGLLDALREPADLRRMRPEQLVALAAEIRQRLISVVVESGGHLGPNLGVVELRIAVHRCFCSPQDAIVWDTGHQAYVHKMLTGRAAQLPSLRQTGGLSGYPSRAESRHDLVENSHASTSLCYVDGLAKGFALTGADRRAVAVIGDGALTGSMSWEALNNIGAGGRPLVVVLNDNGRSYAPTAGALPAHLTALRQGSTQPNLFEQLGFTYLGPVDGHDIAAVEEALIAARAVDGPVLVHCVTRKGAGYGPAETDEADCLHTVSPKAPAGSTASAPSAGPKPPKWTEVFADELLAVGERRDDVVAVTAAMLRPTGLYPFSLRFPDRVFDVGIAEQHAVTSAAGLAMAGLHPVVALYSTFLNRAFDQVLMDVGLHRLPVTFMLDRSGITGPDGPSHHGMWDVSALSLVPGMRLAAPRDAVRLRELFAEALADDRGPTALRYPKDRTGDTLPTRGRIGDTDVLTGPQPARDVLLVPIGSLADAALAAARRLHRRGIPTTVVDPRWLTPIDPALVLVASSYRVVVTVEDNAVSGGFGDGLARAMRTAARSTELVTLGLRPGYVGVGERADLLHAHGLDADGIEAAVCAARTRLLVHGSAQTGTAQQPMLLRVSRLK